jgi:uncharacterized membrane protein YfcA
VNGVELAGGLVLGVVAGILAGALGVGGGVVMVPAMVLFMGLTQQMAQGTSLLVIIPTAISGVYAHYRHGLLRERLTIWAGLVGAFGAAAGSFAALHIEHTRLRQVFAVYLLFVGLRTLLAKPRGEAPEAA